jgi:cyclopropane-fatty-acyl-phospholipid synthase
VATQQSTSTKLDGMAAIAAPVAHRLDALIPGARDFALRFWDGSVLPPATGDPSPRLTIVLRSPRALAYIARRPGQLGLGRAWVSGDLDLEGDLEEALALRERFEALVLSRRDRAAVLLAALRLGALPLRAPAPPAVEARPRGRRHSLARDRAAVRHHYDVPEDFYRILLGPSMTYSCAYFSSRDDTLEEAQERKLELVCRKLSLQPGHRLLDVGCGWGSLVLHAAARHGVRAVGVTLSEPQAAVARERIREAGLADRCEIRVADYREVADGPYDRIASIGMYEHVGEGQLRTYAAHLRRLLAPGGLLLNHGITRLVPRGNPDDSFVARYVFPDGELHQLTAVLRAFEQERLEVRDVESLREHYPLTLRRWAANLDEERAAAQQAASVERERIWRLYMPASARAFERGDVSVHQVLAAAPGAPHGLPLNRSELLPAS